MHQDGIFNCQMTAQGSIKEFLNINLTKIHARKIQLARLSETAKKGNQELISETILW